MDAAVEGGGSRTNGMAVDAFEIDKLPSHFSSWDSFRLDFISPFRRIESIKTRKHNTKLLNKENISFHLCSSSALTLYLSPLSLDIQGEGERKPGKRTLTL
ncbi:Hypothetical predicted protein [Olea europaea subsp. europaea]|uniref:Uncharacterized protein n=1 Tax=Olea europaea subsp. europaea TaxID=158383 RepID=A0A8S0TCE8_OLEEU|nr:Hypothetical predicted protein [Olea europaea subsp. europaea]